MTTTMPASERIINLDISLHRVPAPLAAYVPARRVGEFIYTAGQLPFEDGVLVSTGAVNADNLDLAQRAARQSAINAVAAISELAGGLDNVTEVVKVVGFVASSSSFHDQPAVIDGASNVLLEIFGAEIGQHARSAVGVSALPRDASVEVELIVRVATGK
ncbi:RidA family protein [Arthrobacter sp. HLT1-20]